MKRVSRQVLLGEVGLAMQRYQRSVQAYDDAVGRRLGVSASDMRCLDWLADGPKTAGELAAGVGLRPAATTALIDRLVAKGLVERVRGDVDRRQVLVRMTDEGVRRTAEFYGPLVEEGQRTLRAIRMADLELMRDYLGVITELTDRHRRRVTDG